MRLMIFPAAFMANTFAMMLVMIGLSLFGKPALAADFGLVHGATVALFYSFSGNARSLILGAEGNIHSPRILRMRLLMVLPLGALAWMLCAGVVDGGGLFILLLVLRRAAEWLAEIFLSDQEVQQHGRGALHFFAGQAVFSLLLLLALYDGGWLVLPVTLLWATSPLLGCLDRALVGRALVGNMTFLEGMRVLLPHFGSTAVIGVSVYVFRLFLLLVAGKEVAGDLFSAFALGGILGAVFSQALGPSMVRQEQAAVKSSRLVRLFNLMLVGLLLLGVALGVFVWSLPGVLAWTQKSDFFWMAVACSLVGGAVMVQAQRIRLRIIQGEGSGDVFGSDLLANVLLVASIPFLYYGLGAWALVALYLLSGLLSLFFYASERSGLVDLRKTGWFSEKALLVVIAFVIMLPVFFQLGSGLFVDTTVYFSSGGQLAMLPIPISITACCFGIVLLGRYGDARLALVALFFMFVGMLFVSLLQGGEGKLIMLVQFVLPVFALVLGQQYGSRASALMCLALAGAVMLSVLVPLQLVAAWVADSGYLVPSVFVFSIYQHLQYVPVVFVGVFLVCIFTLSSRPGFSIWLIALSGILGVYASMSLSMLAQGFLLLGLLGFALRSLLRGRVLLPLMMAFSVIIGAFLGAAQISNSPLLSHKYAGSQHNGVSELTAGAQGGPTAVPTGPIKGAGEFGNGASIQGVSPDLQKRQAMWRFYASEISSGGWESLLLGQAETPNRDLYPSAYNYYLDFFYHFGLIGMLPFLLLLCHTLFIIARQFRQLWGRSELLGLAGVVVFFLIVDNSLKVGLRQPYSGILMFFFWGILLAAQKRLLESAAERTNEESSLACALR